MRTALCLNLNSNVNERDLKDFFRDCGRVRSVKIIRDAITGKSKGLAYIEFYDIESINKATQLTGKKFMNHRIIIETSQAEKNRDYAMLTAQTKSVQQTVGGKKVKIQNLHKAIEPSMLKEIFHPFGSILSCTCHPDDSAQNGTQMAFLTFSTPASAKSCVSQMNNFMLADLNLNLTQLSEGSSSDTRSVFDTEVVDRGGINLGKSGRFELMAKLAEGSGLKVPEMKKPSNNGYSSSSEKPIHLPTQCLVISQFFDPKKGITPEEIRAIKDEVIEQTMKHGGVFHVEVDESSLDGNVYVKFQTVGTSMTMYATFSNKTYKNRSLKVAYLPVSTYHQLYPDAVNCYLLLSSSNQLKALN